MVSGPNYHRRIPISQEEADMIDKVTREEVVEAASQVQLDTVYYLTGRGAEDHE